MSRAIGAALLTVVAAGVGCHRPPEVATVSADATASVTTPSVAPSDPAPAPESPPPAAEGVAATPAVAAPPADARRDAILDNVDDLVVRLTEEARLTDEQRARVEALLRDQAERAFAITAASSGDDFEDVGPLLSAVRAETEAKLAEVLTPEQMAIYHRYRRPSAR